MENNMDTQEQLDIVRKVFPDVRIETEDGDHGTRILVNQFLAIEPYPVTRKTLTKSILVDGFMATLDNGEDVEYLYEGANFWDALKEMASTLAMWRVDQVKDKVDPCLVP
jgi:hypothetical protein